MREYFKELMQNMYILTGYRQEQKLTDSQLSHLLDELTRASNKFSKIPEETKRSIIDRSILYDKEFTGLTPRKVYQWLSDYWQQLPQSSRQKLIEPEEEQKEWLPADPEKAQKYIDKLKKNLAALEKTLPKKNAERYYLGKQTEGVKIKQTEIDCPDCDGTNQNCITCKGYGRIKKTLNI